MRTQTLSILISDLQGYTERQARSSRDEIARDLAKHGEILRPVFAAFRGQVVKSMGDAFLVTFESPTDAVLAAVQVQKQLARHNDAIGAGVHPLRVRIGIATGEVARDDAGDVFGDPVNLAARLQASAEADAVWLAETTFLSMNRNEVQAFEVGARVFKGVPGEVKVYRVLDDCIRRTPLLSAAELESAASVSAAGAARVRPWILIGLGVLALAVGGYFALRTGGDRRTPAERFAADPADLVAGDALCDELTFELQGAEERKEMEAVYREGLVAARINELARRLDGRPPFDRLRALFLMANEPLGPGVAEFVEAAVTRHALLRGDARFLRLLRETVEYASKEPAIQSIYARALAASGAGG